MKWIKEKCLVSGFMLFSMGRGSTESYGSRLGSWLYYYDHLMIFGSLVLVCDVWSTLWSCGFSTDTPSGLFGSVRLELELAET